MEILDGFNLWIGKTLAEIAVVIGVIAFLGLLYGGLVVTARIETFLLRRKLRR